VATLEGAEVFTERYKKESQKGDTISHSQSPTDVKNK
jgi:hypothetical protein